MDVSNLALSYCTYKFFYSSFQVLTDPGSKCSHAVFLITHNCRSTTHRFQFWRTNVRFVHHVDVTFSAIKMINSVSENNVKLKKRNHPCLIRFLSAAVTGSKVTSGSTVPALIGWKFTSFPSYLYRFAITTKLAEGREHVLSHKISVKNIIIANDE